MKTYEYKNIQEVMHVYEHESGLKAIVIPKKGYQKKYATFATHYGSIDTEFIIPGDTTGIKVPDGIAHFLEHKLFDQEYGNVMDEFAKLGSQSNAYTSFNQTVYLFSCTDNFNDNFKLLLKFVQNPYLTDESIEKEKGIIAQEIKMYQDNPSWRVFFNFLQALYNEHPVRLEIAGTVESIYGINKDVLYKCYNTFYHPSNMVILVVGDVSYEEVFDMVKNLIKTKDKKQDVTRIFKNEASTIHKSYVEQSLQIATPIFKMGFKDNIKISSGIDYLKRDIIMNIILELLMGRTSKFYNELYVGGLINNTFEFDYSIEENYAFSMFGGESTNPSLVKEKLEKEIESINKTGFSEQSYNRIKKALKGKALRQLNSVEGISRAVLSVCFKKINVFDYYELFDNIVFEDINKVFKEHFIIDKLSLSVIKPL